MFGFKLATENQSINLFSNVKATQYGTKWNKKGISYLCDIYLCNFLAKYVRLICL